VDWAADGGAAEGVPAPRAGAEVLASAGGCRVQPGWCRNNLRVGKYSRPAARDRLPARPSGFLLSTHHWPAVPLPRFPRSERNGRSLCQRRQLAVVQSSRGL
jgi:hypothetical protein